MLRAQSLFAVLAVLYNTAHSEDAPDRPVGYHRPAACRPASGQLQARVTELVFVVLTKKAHVRKHLAQITASTSVVNARSPSGRLRRPPVQVLREDKV